MLKAPVLALLKRPALLAASALLLSVIPQGFAVAMVLMACAIMRLGVGALPVTLLLGAVAWLPLHANSSGLPLLVWGQVLVMALCHQRCARWSDTLMLGTVLTVGAVMQFPEVWLRPGAEFMHILSVMRSNDVLADWLTRLPSDTAALRWINGAAAASVFVMTSLIMILARALQAALFNPQGFGREFRAFRFSPVLALAALAMAVALWVCHQSPLAMLPLFVLAMAGIALAHALVHQRGLSNVWLCGFYTFVVLTPLGMSIVLLLGIVDAFVNIRNRLPHGQH